MAASRSSTATDERAAGAAPAGPERLSAREWASALKRAGREFLADDCMGLSQQVAFSSILAFFPAMIFLIGLLGLLGIYDQLMEFLGVVAPGAVLDAVAIAQASAEGRPTAASLAFVLGAFGAAWAASGAMTTVIKAVNRAYDRTESRPFWKTRLVAIVLVAATGTITAALFLLIVFGGPLGTAIAERVGLGGAFELLWTLLRWPLAFVAVVLFFGLVYYLAPDEEQRSWKWISPGSLVGAVLWLALSGLFALYTSFAANYDATYGSLAGGIVFLLWLNYSAFALLFGAELNSELDRQADIRPRAASAGLVPPARRRA